MTKQRIEQSTEVVRVYFTPREKKKFQEFAKRHGKSMSSLLGILATASMEGKHDYKGKSGGWLFCNVSFE